MRPPYWLLLYPFALLLNLRNWESVFTADGLFPRGTDSYYHLRRISYALHNLPHVPDYDRYLNFPDGGLIRWPYGFDLLYALAVNILTLGKADEWWVWALSSLLTPLLWSLVPCITYLIVECLDCRTTGYIAGLLLAIFMCDYNSIGYIDHHYMEAVWISIYLFFYVGALKASDSASSSRRAVISGVALTFGLLTTTTLPLMLVLHIVVVGLTACFAPSQRSQLLKANSLLAIGLLISLLPFATTHIAETHEINPALTTCWLAAWLMLTGTLISRYLVKKEAGRLEVAAAVLLAAVAFPLIDWHRVLEFAFYGLGHIHKVDPWLAGIQESQSMLFAGIDFVLGVYTGFILFWPISLFYTLWRAWRQNEIGLLSIALLALLSSPVAFIQLKFLLFIAVPYAVVTAYALKALLERIWIAAEAQMAMYKLARIAVLVLIPVLLWPAISKMATPASVVSPDGRFQGLYPTLRWLRLYTPATSREGNLPTDYGVATHWGSGHWVVAIAERPVVGSPLGGPEKKLRDSIRIGSLMLLSPPDEALRLMLERRIRYVVISPQPLNRVLQLAYWDAAQAKPLKAYDEQTALNQSLFLALFNNGLPVGTVADREALRHFRLVHESPEGISWPGTDQPFAMVYEIVEGARISGSAPPGSRVDLSAQIETPRRTFVYSDSVQADSTGRFTFLAPYSTEAHKYSEVRASSYLLRTSTSQTVVKVSNEQVLQGANIEVILQKESRPLKRR